LFATYVKRQIGLVFTRHTSHCQISFSIITCLCVAL